MSPSVLRTGLRGRLLLTVTSSVAVAVAVLILICNLALRQQLHSDVDSLLRGRAAAALSGLSTVDGRLIGREAPDRAAVDSPVWTFGARGALERPSPVAPALDRAATRLVGGPRTFVEIDSPAARLLAVPVVVGARRVGTVVVAASEGPYRRTERVVLVGSLLLAAALVLAVGLISRWLLSAALRPVDQMTSEADEWSERDLERRFGLGPPTDEITHLAATLDGLLDRVAAAMRREQRFSAELSHELRTPLTKISTRAQLLAADPALPGPVRKEARAIVAATGQMSDAIEALMAAARADGNRTPASSDPAVAVRAAIDAAREPAARRDVRLEFVEERHAGRRVSAESALVQRILAPLLENASRMAAGSVRVTLEWATSSVDVVVLDDGSGVAVADAERIFDPGARGAADHGGAGLGLALARRLARSAGGDVHADPTSEGGRFVVSLPAA